MKIAVDESGNYGLGSERFESYVLCALIVPDSRLNMVERFVEDARRRWHRRELKSSRMKPQWIKEVADLLAGSQIAAVAYVADNEVMTKEIVAEFRVRQAAAIARGRRRVLDANPDYPHIADIDALLDRVAGARSRERLADGRLHPGAADTRTLARVCPPRLPALQRTWGGTLISSDSSSSSTPSIPIG